MCKAPIKVVESIAKCLATMGLHLQHWINEHATVLEYVSVCMYKKVTILLHIKLHKGSSYLQKGKNGVHR